MVCLQLYRCSLHWMYMLDDLFNEFQHILCSWWEVPLTVFNAVAIKAFHRYIINSLSPPLSPCFWSSDFWPFHLWVTTDSEGAPMGCIVTIHANVMYIRRRVVMAGFFKMYSFCACRQHLPLLPSVCRHFLCGAAVREQKTNCASTRRHSSFLQ